MKKEQKLAPIFGAMIYTLNKAGVTNLTFSSKQSPDDPNDIEVTIGFFDKKGRQTNLVWHVVKDKKGEKGDIEASLESQSMGSHCVPKVTRSYKYKGDMKTLTYKIPMGLISTVDDVMSEISSIPLGANTDDSNFSSYIEQILSIAEEESNKRRSRL